MFTKLLLYVINAIAVIILIIHIFGEFAIKDLSAFMAMEILFISIYLYLIKDK
jgi:hypothetical protein